MATYGYWMSAKEAAYVKSAEKLMKLPAGFLCARPSDPLTRLVLKCKSLKRTPAEAVEAIDAKRATLAI